MFGTAELTDDVVRSAADGSPPALARVADALSPQVRLMVAARLLPTPAQYHAAEDICQQVMTALARGLDRLEHRTVGGLKAYVSGIVRNQVAETLRKWQREGGRGRRVRSLESNVGTALHSSPLWQQLSGSVISPRSAVDRAEQTERVLLELGRLKDAHREIITLAFFDQLPVRDIAEQMHVTPRAASMMLLRAVRALQDRVGAVVASGRSDV